MLPLRAINLKLVRELWRMKGQMIAIVLLVGAAVSTFLSSISVYQSLHQARTEYYSGYRFANVFASANRAPERVADRIREIPGVAAVQTRVQKLVSLDLPHLDDPATGLLVSIPETRQPILNDICLLEGHWPEAGSTDQVVISEQFADGNHFKPGDTFLATINGRRKQMHIAGIGLSPEFIYALKPGAMMPDNVRYGIMWMPRPALAAAMNMQGAFNSVTLTTTLNASEAAVIAGVDDLLKRYGGTGAYGREHQQSHQFLSSEFEQLQINGIIVPLVFLGIAIFLLNIVLTRLVKTQREIIGSLRAFGYTRGQVARHYLGMVALVVALGYLFGIALGAWSGRYLADLYGDYYYFPNLAYRMDERLLIAGAILTFLLAAVGTINAVRTAATLPPAQAMQPEPPPRYRKTLVERLGLSWLFSQPTRMILRNLGRQPLKAGLSVLGISLAVAMLVLGMFFIDSVKTWLAMTYDLGSREDVMVTFTDSRSQRVAHDLQTLPGVQLVEGYRAVPVKFVKGNRSRNSGIMGLSASPELHRLIEDDMEIVKPPERGLLISTVLADVLGVRAGEFLRVEVLEGRRTQRDVLVTGLVDDLTGTSGYMEIGELHKLVGEGGCYSGAFLSVEESQVGQLYDELKAAPAVAAVSLTQQTRRDAEEMMDEFLLTYSIFQVVLASLIAFGVVYNFGRISLSERSRELVSMRVLGFTRGEISYILLGEMAILTVLALPLGCWMGVEFAKAMMGTVDPEIFRLPMIVSERTYAFAISVVLIASALTALVVRRRLDTLDLVAVLKVKE